MSCCPVDSEPPRPTAATTSSGLTKHGATSLDVAGPSSARVGVLAFPDIFGTESGRTRADADALGARGYAVVVVDAAHGDYINPEGERPDMVMWLKKHDFDTVLLPRIRDAIDYLKTNAQVQEICSYGYCWGGWIGARLAAVENERLVQGHISFHPSWRVENMLHGDGYIEKLAEQIHAPQLLLSAENDPECLKENGSVQSILANCSLDAHTAKWSAVVDFPEVKHGWVNRGDLTDPTVQANVDRAWLLAREFIERVTTAA